MKRSVIIASLSILFFALDVIAADTFPVFHSVGYTIKIPTNTIGYRADPDNVIGTNVVYHLTGQIFTNQTAASTLQSTADGFSGSTEKSTPWKTLTEMYAISQQGVSSNTLAQLYTPESKSFLDMVFTNSATETYYRNYALSFTNISVSMGYEMTNAYVAIVTIKTKASPTPDVLPFFFVKSNGSYFLSSYTFLSPREQNIGVFLNSHSAGDLIR